MIIPNRTAAVVNLAVIEENLDRLLAPLPEGTRCCLVLKTDGYGHGAVPIARKLTEKADFFAVATEEEAYELREAGLSNPILILGHVWPEEFEKLISLDIRFPIFKEEDALLASQAGLKAGKPALVHIKVNTGMNRIGFETNAAGVEAVRRIRRMPGLCTEGIFTHFARADETDKSSAEDQLERFKAFAAATEKDLGRYAIRHCANSAASMEMPEAWMDMVRIGISLYGIYPSDEMNREAVVLNPALSWKSRVVLIQEHPAGAGISYGHTAVLREARRVATIPVGYGDGYPRSLSNKGTVLIRGHRAPILGRVCMDQFMADVTDVPGVQDGDTVTLVGRDGDDEITVDELAELSGRFPYEFVCDIGKRVPRVYLGAT